MDRSWNFKQTTAATSARGARIQLGAGESPEDAPVPLTGLPGAVDLIHWDLIHWRKIRRAA